MRSIFFIAVLCWLALSAAGGAYGTWEPPAPDPAIDTEYLDDAILRLEAAVIRADDAQAAHPDFLADLYDILDQLIRARGEIADSAPPPAAETPAPPIQEPEHFYTRVQGTLTQDHPSQEHTLQLPANGDLIVTVHTGSDLLLSGSRLYDVDGTTSLNTFRQSSGSTDTHVFSNLRAGRYTIKFQKDGRSMYHGEYRAEIELRPVSVPADREPNDSFQEANVLSPNSTVTGHLGMRGQGRAPDMEDWYKITIPENGHLHLELTTSGSHGSGQENTHEVSALRAGTYYIAVVKDGRSMYWGSYTLRADFKPFLVEADREPNDSPDDRGVITLHPGDRTTGHLGTRGQQEPADQEDWFRIVLPQNGHLDLEISTSGERSGTTIRAEDGALNLASIQLYDSDGTTRISSTGHGSGQRETYRIQALRAGTYYLRMAKDGRSMYWGSYTIDADHTPFSRPADQEPNDDPRDRGVQTIRPGQKVTGDLGTRGQLEDTDNRDIWVIDHRYSGTLEFRVATSGDDGWDEEDGRLNLNSVQVFSDRGLSNRVFSSGHRSGQEQTYSIADLAAGSYYLVLNKDGRSMYYGSYEIEVMP